MGRKIKRFGWTPDLPDQRDHLYGAPLAVMKALPASADLRRRCPPVLNQGNLGSCTANAIANAHRFDQRKQHLAGEFAPSRLFIYYNERAMEGSTGSDSGAQIRDGIKSIAKQGVCPESEWPYVPARFTSRPPAPCYREASKHQAVSYQRLVQTLSQMKGCLASGYPFVFGFTVYESFESQTVARTGVLDMPRRGEHVVGGHAVLAAGYDDAAARFTVMNSWGTSWGRGGYFTIPYLYLADADLAADFWTVRIVEAGDA
jgi:C1A family cysteine protease